MPVESHRYGLEGNSQKQLPKQGQKHLLNPGKGDSIMKRLRLAPSCLSGDKIEGRSNTSRLSRFCYYSCTW